jgi:hypothetical protein
MTTVTAELVHCSDTAALQGWDAVDRLLLGYLRRAPASLVDLVDGSGYPAPIVRDAVLGYLQGGLAVRGVGATHRYELTLAGRARWAQLAESTVPAMRQAA